MTLRLPRKEYVSVTSEDDPIEFYYKPFLRHLLIKRLHIAFKLLGKGTFKNILDIGFGGGILLPELASKCSSLFGIDIHSNISKVKKMAEKENISAHLIRADITALPFQNNTFDGVLSLSVLEHIHQTNLNKAIDEIKRISSKDAKIVLLFPIQNKLTDLLLVKTSDIDLRRQHPSSHRDILKAIKQVLHIKKILCFPSNLIPIDYNLFLGCLCTT